jgi:hypothetical protein
MICRMRLAGSGNVIMCRGEVVRDQVHTHDAGRVRRAKTLPTVGKLSNEAWPLGRRLGEIVKRERLWKPAPFDLIGVQETAGTDLYIVDSAGVGVGDSDPFHCSVSECLNDQAGGYTILWVVATNRAAFPCSGRQRLALVHVAAVSSSLKVIQMYANVYTDDESKWQRQVAVRASA